MDASCTDPASARITLLPSGRELQTSARQSILDAALREGINLPHSCKGGHCGSCRARLLQGAVSYPAGQPPGLTAQEHADGYALLCQARVASTNLVIEARDVHPPVEIELKSLPCRVERLERLAPDVMALFLRPPAAESFDYLPGQYLDVMLSSQRRRSFSIANAPQASSLLELHIARVSDGEFTRRVFETLEPGALLRIEGPLGQFWFRRESPRPALFVAGGTGYAPIRAMLEALLSAGDRRRLHLYWGAREVEHLYERARLRDWLNRWKNFVFTPVLSSPDATWQGRKGLVHETVLQDVADLANFDVYAAGPPALIEAVRADFVAHGLPPEQLFFDSFDFAPDALARHVAGESA